MKIRNGFVSNSSSSSFIAVCKRIDENDLNINDIENGKIYAIGECLNDGSDIFKVEDEFAIHLIKNSNTNFELLKCFKIGYEEINFSKNDLEVDNDDDEMTIVSEYQDYGHSQNTKDVYVKYFLGEMWCRGEDMTEKQIEKYNKLKNQFTRSKKLKRVLK